MYPTSTDLPEFDIGLNFELGNLCSHLQQHTSEGLAESRVLSAYLFNPSLACTLTNQPRPHILNHTQILVHISIELVPT